MKQEKSCNNCMKGARININNDILCMLKGVVSADYICAKHKMIPVSKSVREQKHRCINCEFFILNAMNAKNHSSLGFCQLFTVREFDGEQKNACSRFCMKSERIVS